MGQTGLLKTITHQKAAIAAAALAMVLVAAFLSSIVSAQALSTRSITPSTASTSAPAESVQYTVKFTPETAAGAFVIDFCDSASGPLLGQSCDAPTGMDVSNAATATGGVTLSTEAIVDANTLAATKTMAADVEQEITFTGITNPSDAGVTYARIVTYANGTDAEGYVSTNPSAVGAVVDSGSVAMYFNDTINVYGTVLETMTFCVSGAIINANCAGASTPTIRLGEETATGSGVFALTESAVSEGTLHTQINTNAASGVVIRLKSSAECGGLKRAGSDQCDIEAALDGDVTAGSARFGVKTATATNAPGATNAIGAFQPYIGDPESPSPAYYLTNRFSFNYVSANPTTQGVTSTFGDPFLDTNGAPATGKNMALTFGASVSSNTPAGLYSTDLSMIAVGKF